MKRTSSFFIFLVFLPAAAIALVLLSCGVPPPAAILPEPDEPFILSDGIPREPFGGRIIPVNDTAGSTAPDIQRIVAPSQSRAERVFTALRLAYPDQITEFTFRDGDWALRVRNTWYYWANGRLLPESERRKWEEYDVMSFYTYASELPLLPQYTPEDKDRFNAVVKQMDKKPVKRHSGFFNEIWRINDRDTAWSRVKSTYFLGLKTMIHRELLEDLAAVEEDIEAAMKKDAALREFVKSITQVTGFNWRPIAGTETLSFHSYGAALDITPKQYKGKQVYWLWARNSVPEWFSLPYESRFMPPEPFIRAFENHGFVWGGKWTFFDTVHFEYRPDIFYLNEIPMKR